MAHTFVAPITISGSGSPAAVSNTRLNSFDTVDSYLQINIQNLGNGLNSSADLIATCDTGTDSTGYVDWGINGSAYNVGTWTVNGAGDGYGYCAGGHLALGTINAGKELRLFTGGTLAANIRMYITDESLSCRVPLVVEDGLGVRIGQGEPSITGGALYNLLGNLYWNGKSLAEQLNQVATLANSGNVTLIPTPEVSTIRLTLQGNVTLGISNSGYDGQRISVELIQSAGGGNTVTLGSGIAYGSDIPNGSFVMTSTANKTDILGFVYHAASSAWRLVAVAKGY